MESKIDLLMDYIEFQNLNPTWDEFLESIV